MLCVIDDCEDVRPAKAVKAWIVALDARGGAAGRGVDRSGRGLDSFSCACAIRTAEGASFVVTEELVVLIENVDLDFATAVFPFASSAAAATKAAVGLPVVWVRVSAVVWAKVLVVVWVVRESAVTVPLAIYSAIIFADARGIAVQRRPSMVVRNAPFWTPSGAIFNTNRRYLARLVAPG